jgi:histidinol phosphatase-like PHP family hydrolase
MSSLRRREFLASGIAGFGAAFLVRGPAGAASSAALGTPIDFHVHLDRSTIDKVVELSRQRGVKFGIVEHAGTKENIYPTVLSNDQELAGYLKMLDGHPVFRGVQTEWTDWASGFSPAMLARLDYVLTDGMTFPGKDGRRVKLWEKDVESRVEMADREAFMERYVDWYLQIIARPPLDIFANFSWLPKPLAADYEKFWTPKRMQRIVDAMVKHRVAMEISASYKLPSRAFVEMAKAAGVKFSFGSNGRYPNMGKLEYSLQMAADVGLTPAQMFQPRPR